MASNTKCLILFLHISCIEIICNNFIVYALLKLYLENLILKTFSWKLYLENFILKTGFKVRCISSGCRGKGGWWQHMDLLKHTYHHSNSWNVSFCRCVVKYNCAGFWNNLRQESVAWWSLLLVGAVVRLRSFHHAQVAYKMAAIMHHILISTTENIFQILATHHTALHFLHAKTSSIYGKNRYLQLFPWLSNR